MTVESMPLVDPLEELAALASAEERELHFAETSAEERRDLVDRICDRTNRLVLVDHAAAERLLDIAAWLVESLEDHHARGRWLRSTGNLLFFQRDYRGAVDKYRLARTVFETLDDRPETARTLSTALVALGHLGEYEAAEEWGRTAARLCEGIGDPPLRARLEINRATVLAQRDRNREALERFRAAYSTLRTCGRPADIAAVLRNIAVSHQQLHELDEADAAYAEAKVWCEEHGLGRLALEIDYNIAFLDYFRGEYTRAIGHFEAVRRRCVGMGDDHHRALCDLDLAQIYLELNLNEEAGELARRAASEFERLGMRYESAKAMTHGAVAAERCGDWPAALEGFERARERFAELGNRFWSATVALTLAQALYERGRLREATESAKSALFEFERSALRTWIAKCEILLARIALEKADFDTAHLYCKFARRRLDGLGSPALESQALLVSALAAEARGDLDEAFDGLARALLTRDELRSRLRSDEVKVAFSRDQQSIYEGLFSLVLQRDPEFGQRRAYDFVQQAKSRGLSDLLAGRLPDLEPADSGQAKLLTGIGKLREEANVFHRQIDEEESKGIERSPELLAELRASARDRERQLMRSLRAMQQASPELGELQSAEGVELEAIQESLPAESQLLEFFVARGVIHGCVLDREGLWIEPLAEFSKVRKAHSVLQIHLGKFQLCGKARDVIDSFPAQNTRLVLEQLYDGLIAPIRHRLRRERLLVAPHGLLHHLPVHAFFDGARHLLDEFVVSYAPSGTVLDLCSRRPASAASESLILGIPDRNAPLIEDECRRLAEIIPDARLFIGEIADADNLRRFGASCRYLHIATHGIFRRDNPMFSSLRLGTSRLSLFDLYNLRLDADLAVLSGCATGLSAVEGADELIGLVRGLLYAGVRSLMVSLWNVDDESTCRFMPRFYEHLVAGQPPAQALNMAQREHREEYEHPYYWAPFIVVG